MDDIQKKKLRLIIEANPSAEYMEQLAADDEFAVSEIEAKQNDLLQLKKDVAANLEAQKDAIEYNLEKVYADIAILEG